MRLKRVSYMLVACAALAGCSKDTDGEITTLPPLAGLRFVNMIPDTVAVNIRVTDVVGYAPNTVGASFRTAGSPFGLPITGVPMHTAVQAGNRQVKVFLSSTDPAVATVEVLTTNFTFVEGTNYTLYLSGYANTANGTPAASAVIVEDGSTDPGAGNIGVRVVDLAPTLAPTLAGTTVDVWIDGLAAGSAPVGAPTFAAVAMNEVRNYSTRPTGAARAVIAAAGTTTPVIEVALPAGAAGTSTTQPTPGTAVAGTSFTILVMPPSAPGTGAPQTAAFLAPAAMAVIDRLPPRTAP